MIRKIRNGDIDKLMELEKIAAHKFDLTEAMSSAVVEHEGKIIAFGGLIPQVEAAILVDRSTSAMLRANAIRELYDNAVEVAKVYGTPQLLAFVNDQRYAAFLEKRFGFERKPEMVLALEF